MWESRVLCEISNGVLAGQGLIAGVPLTTPANSSYRLRFATGATTPVVTLPQDAVVASPGLALSPDGRWLLYGQRDRSVSDIMLVEPFR